MVRHRGRFCPVCCNLLQSRVNVLTSGFVRCKALWNLCTVPSLLIQVHQWRWNESAVVFSPLVGGFHPFHVLDDLVSASVIQTFFPTCQANRLAAFAYRLGPSCPKLFKAHFSSSQTLQKRLTAGGRFAFRQGDQFLPIRVLNFQTINSFKLFLKARPYFFSSTGRHL